MEPRFSNYFSFIDYIKKKLFLIELLPNPPHVSNTQYTVIVADADLIGLYVKEIVATSRDTDNNVVQTSGVIDTGMSICLFKFYDWAFLQEKDCTPQLLRISS